MGVDINFVIGGEAGQGIQSMSVTLGKTLMRGGYEVFISQDFESRIRGGHSSAAVRIADRPIAAMSGGADILIALNAETIDIHRPEMAPGSLTICDREALKLAASEGDGILDVPLQRLALEKGGDRVMSNTVAVGALLGLVGYDFDPLAVVLREEFAGRDPKIVEGNVAAARAGYDQAREQGGRAPRRVSPQGEAGRRMLLTGNDAVALGAMAAGCQFVAGYPMTPTTSILEFIAEKGRPFNIPVVQAEDEIAAANMVVGAAYAGARAMTATSGGGFCLMVEALSLAAMTETPMVVVLGQRPGPAIGLPTRTEQSDLEFALYGGHGGFQRPVLAPGSVAEAFRLTVKAFNIADRYQTPVIVITDHDLADSFSTVARFDLGAVRIDRGETISDEQAASLATYKRHLITESGISPRAWPMQGRFLVATDSDEHDEEGHMIEDAETRTRMVLKRQRKLASLPAEMDPPEVTSRAGAEMTLVGWGSTRGAIREAAELLEAQGVPATVVHLSSLWPFPADALAQALSGSRRTIVIESNSTGQLARLIRAETGIGAHRSLLKFDGRQFSPRYIVDALKKEVP